MNKIRILLEQVDEAIVQENSVKDTSVELTPSMLSNIVDELKEVLEHQPATQDKEQKKTLREKKKQVRALEGYTTITLKSLENVTPIPRPIPVPHSCA